MNYMPVTDHGTQIPSLEKIRGDKLKKKRCRRTVEKINGRCTRREPCGATPRARRWPHLDSGRRTQPHLSVPSPRHGQVSRQWKSLCMYGCAFTPLPRHTGQALLNQRTFALVGHVVCL